MIFDWAVIMLCAVGISILLTAFLVPNILHVALSKRLFDRPGGRKIHKGIVPAIGGFSFLPVIVMTLGLTLLIPAAYFPANPVLESSDFVVSLPDILVLLAAMTIMYLIGLYDDLLGVKYGSKLIAQIICAVILVEAGLYIADFYDLLGITGTSVAIGKLITGFLIVYIVNGMNLIDGIDGLASGMGVVALSFYGIMLYRGGLFMFSLLSWVGAASMAVFWIFNVFGDVRKHTKIFMGDIGSLTLGLLISFMVICVGRNLPLASVWASNPIVLALSPLVLPLFDEVRVFFVRIALGKGPFLPDKRHIHHIMLDGRFSVKGAMATLICTQIAIIVFNLWLSASLDINVILCFDVAVYASFVLIMILNRKIKK